MNNKEDKEKNFTTNNTKKNGLPQENFVFLRQPL